ncbi:cytochrome P450 [Nocardia salmonicida]|uniref:cytochrome P450 n=1 Tax=Nocardia salmonicida TaxID=53431 RepID=UPI0007A50FF1|nr:cytochrome P450 [Nocardia salmonicida]
MSNYKVAHHNLALPDLSMRHRTGLFHQIRFGIASPAPDVTTATFGDTRGVVIANYPLARQILNSSAGVKSRPEQSQHKLGGVGALRGNEVRPAKADLLVALRQEADDVDALRRNLEAAFSRHGVTEPGTGSLTEALSSALIAQLLGESLCKTESFALRTAISDTWQHIESAATPLDTQDEPTPLENHLRPAASSSSSRFLRTLRTRGWTDDRIIKELNGMLLAGWGSTTALVLSTSALGASKSAALPEVQDEVLRLYPPSFMIARRVIEQIPEIPISRGDIVLISPWLIHRNTASWDVPDEFLPTRWRLGERSRSWFLPFGIGVRRCPAARFARTQAVQACQLLQDSPAPARTVVTLIENRSPALVGQDWDSSARHPAAGGPSQVESRRAEASGAAHRAEREG